MPKKKSKSSLLSLCKCLQFSPTALGPQTQDKNLTHQVSPVEMLGALISTDSTVKEKGTASPEFNHLIHRHGELRTPAYTLSTTPRGLDVPKEGPLSYKEQHPCPFLVTAPNQSCLLAPSLALCWIQRPFAMPALLERSCETPACHKGRPWAVLASAAVCPASANMSISFLISLKYSLGHFYSSP